MNAGRASRLSHATTGLLLVVGLLALAGGIAIRVAGLHIQTVLSNSMQPTVSAGDAAITQAVPIGALRVGDVIVFYPPNDTRAHLHRITSLTVENGETTITTRGDANQVDDPWHAVLSGSTAYRLVGVAPLLGWLERYRGLLFVAAGLLTGAALLRGALKEVRLRRPSQAAS